MSSRSLRSVLSLYISMRSPSCLHLSISHPFYCVILEEMVRHDEVIAPGEGLLTVVLRLRMACMDNQSAGRDGRSGNCLVHHAMCSVSPDHVHDILWLCVEMLQRQLRELLPAPT